MPKELTHLMIAEMAAHRFSDAHPQGLLSTCIHRYIDEYRFGAVMHDIAFFGSSSRQGCHLKDRGLAIHGATPDDILGPLRYLAAAFDATGEPSLLAMTAGAVTHMMADTLFHPVVYYFSGHELARHYRLETLIDTHLARRQPLWLKRSVDPLGLYSPLRGKFDRLAVHLTGFLGLPEAYLPEIVKALKRHVFTLTLFRSRFGYLLFRLVSALGSNTFQNKAFLFYPPAMRFDAPFFRRNFHYRHPVTGEYLTSSLDLLVETAARQACDRFETIQTAAENRNLEFVVSGLPAISLETGLSPSIGRQFRYIDCRTPIDRLVSRG